VKVYRNKKAEANILRTYDRLLASWEVEIIEKDIPTTYGSTHVIQWGRKTNPPLILFHGVGDDSPLMWVYNAKALQEHFSLYAIDTIGGPGKSRPNDNYTKGFDDLAWIDQVLDGLSLLRQSICIAGVSHGAYLAQLYGLHRPDQVKKILCMAGTVPAGNASPIKTMMKIFLPEALFPTPKNVVKLLCKLSGKHHHVFTENPDILEHYECLLKGFNNMAMSYHKIESFSRRQIDAIRDKSFFLVGEEDPFMILGGKDMLLQFNMKARFFPEAGHGINHELSQEINQIIAEYFLGDQ